jgi:hypothetical protein
LNGWFVDESEKTYDLIISLISLNNDRSNEKKTREENEIVYSIKNIDYNRLLWYLLGLIWDELVSYLVLDISYNL